MNLNEYQQEAAKNKAFPEKYAIIYPTIGVLNEAGEMAGKVKKWMRGDGPLNIQDLTSEMGDVLWYLSSLATDLNITLEDVARNNIEKITKRREKNMIKGDGDHREEDKTVIIPRDLPKLKQGIVEPFEGDILDPDKVINDETKQKYIESLPKKYRDTQGVIRPVGPYYPD